MTILDEVCEGIVDCEHKTAPKSDFGYPSIRTTDITNGRIDFVGANRVSKETYIYWTKRRIPKSGDLILAREAPVGEVGYIPEGETPVLGQRTVLISPDREKVFPRYLHYLLLSPAIQHELEVRSSGSTVHHLNMKDIRALEMPALPPLPEQRQIAAILGALDDKIELNRKMSATLEEMARALYRSWFVDFDPVHAKVAGRAPAHMDAQTASLFPDSFGEDGLPEGWEWSTVSAVCEHVKQTVKPMGQADQLFHHFSLPAFDAKRVPAAEHGKEIRSNKCFVPNNAVLFSRLNPSIPRVWWAQTNEETAIPAASTEFYVAKALQDSQTPWLYCLMSSAGFRDEALFRVTGTSNSHQRVPPTTFADIEVIKPTDNFLHAFGDICGNWFERGHAMSKENQTLAALRDTLLPRLMSGELRVGEARQQVEEHV